MNREEIIKMAREVWGDDSGKPWHESAVTHLEVFAALVAAAERKACIDVVLAGTGEPVQTETLKILRTERERIAKTIEARGQQ